MLDSERTFNTKVRSSWTVFKILLTSAGYLHLNSFLWKRDCPISSKCHKVDQGHSKKLL